MAQNSKSRKEGVVKRFLRLFPAYREMEKTIQYKNEGSDLSAAVILAYREATESDTNLMKSLNRYIGALEGRDKERVKRINELERECNELREHLRGKA